MAYENDKSRKWSNQELKLYILHLSKLKIFLADILGLMLI